MVPAQNNPFFLLSTPTLGIICIPLSAQTHNWSLQCLWSAGTVESLSLREGSKFESRENGVRDYDDHHRAHYKGIAVSWIISQPEDIGDCPIEIPHKISQYGLDSRELFH